MISRREFFQRLSGGVAVAFVARYGVNALDDSPISVASGRGERSAIVRELIEITDKAGGISPAQYAVDRGRWCRLFDEMLDPEQVMPMYAKDGFERPHIMVAGIPIVFEAA